MSNDKQTLIERIKKLLALSNDSSTTEHEKDVALNRAKDLMAQYAIEEHQLKGENVKDLIEIVEYTPKLENPLPSYLFNPALFNAIISPIAQNFGCYCAFYLHSNKTVFYGFKTNIEVAQYACDVLLNAGIKDFRAGYRVARTIGFATTFWNGFGEGLAKRFTKLSDETAVILYDKVKNKWESEVKSVQVELPSSTEKSGHAAGFKSATEAQLNAGLTERRENLLK